MKISVMIVGNDHKPNAEKALLPFFQQTADSSDFEIIFIDSEESLEYKKAALLLSQQHPKGPQLVYKTLAGASRARCNNEACRLAKGEIFLFFGDDFIPHSELIALHQAFHKRCPGEHFVGVGTAFISHSAKNKKIYSYLESSGALFGVPFLPGMNEIDPRFFYTANSSVKRKFLERCGVFNEAFPFDCWDDFEMGQRMLKAGMISRLIVGAEVEHDHPLTLLERMRQMMRSGYSAHIYQKEHPEEQLACYAKLKHSLFYFICKALLKRVKYFFRGRQKDLYASYAALLDLYFVRGYRRACRAQKA